MLCRLLEKRLEARKIFWSCEVSFDKGTSQERRIDYLAFKPWTPGYAIEPVSVELGRFECYEIKSCMSDFKSGHGLTFYGDENYLVCPRDLYIQLAEERELPRDINNVLCPSASGGSLRKQSKTDMNAHHQSYRKRVASEMLWQMVQSHYWGSPQAWQAGNKQLR